MPANVKKPVCPKCSLELVPGEHPVTEVLDDIAYETVLPILVCPHCGSEAHCSSTAEELGRFLQNTARQIIRLQHVGPEAFRWLRRTHGSKLNLR